LIYNQLLSPSSPLLPSPGLQECAKKKPPSSLYIASDIAHLEEKDREELFGMKQVTIRNVTVPVQMHNREIGGVVGAIVDYYICEQAETSFIGNREMSTFSSVALLERSHPFVQSAESLFATNCSFHILNNGDVLPLLENLRVHKRYKRESLEPVASVL
jgi:hypothetical protein